MEFAERKMEIPAQLKVRANAGLSAVLTQVEAVKSIQIRRAKCVGASAQLMSQIATTHKARLVLSRLFTKAHSLEAAYIRQADNLRDEAALSDHLWWVNGGLSVCYIAVAVGKISDMYASATGLGKVVTTAKSSFLDMTDAMRKNDGLMAGAHAANLTMLGVGKEVVDLTKSFETLQQILHAILNLIKDFKVMWSGNDLGKTLPQFRQATPRFLDLVAKFTDTLNRITSLGAIYQKATLPKLAGAVASENTKIFADSLGAVKYGIEAVVNLFYALNSGIDWWENWDASAQDKALADRMLMETGGGRFDREIDDIATMSEGDEREVMYSVRSAVDADRLASTTGLKAKQLDADAARMRNVQANLECQLGPLNMELKEGQTRLEEIDTQLLALRKEFQALEPGRTVYSLQVAIWLSDIDSKRARIAEAIPR